MLHMDKSQLIKGLDSFLAYVGLVRSAKARDDAHALQQDLDNAQAVIREQSARISKLESDLEHMIGEHEEEMERFRTSDEQYAQLARQSESLQEQLLTAFSAINQLTSQNERRIRTIRKMALKYKNLNDQDRRHQFLIEQLSAGRKHLMHANYHLRNQVAFVAAEYARTALESPHLPFFALNPAGTVAFCSKQAASYLRIPKEMIYNHPLSDFIEDPSQKELFEHGLDRLARRIAPLIKMYADVTVRSAPYPTIVTARGIYSHKDLFGIYVQLERYKRRRWFAPRIEEDTYEISIPFPASRSFLYAVKDLEFKILQGTEAVSGTRFVVNFDCESVEHIDGRVLPKMSFIAHSLKEHCHFLNVGNPLYGDLRAVGVTPSQMGVDEKSLRQGV